MREIAGDENSFYSNEEPLIFFHYSSYFPSLERGLSKYDSDLDITVNEPIKKIISIYRQKLADNRYEELSEIEYSLASNGSKNTEQEIAGDKSALRVLKTKIKQIFR